MLEEFDQSLPWNSPVRMHLTGTLVRWPRAVSGAMMRQINGLLSAFDKTSPEVVGYDFELVWRARFRAADSDRISIRGPVRFWRIQNAGTIFVGDGRELTMTCSVMRREPLGSVPSSAKPTRPWAVGRQLASGEIEWLRDKRGRARTFSDEKAATTALCALSTVSGMSNN